MPPKKAVEAEKSAECCTLKIGRFNNVVQWKEDMQNMACGLYGMTGLFFSTNMSYFHPFPREEDYNPAYVHPPPDDEDDEEEEDDDDAEEAGPAAPAAPAVPVVPQALIDKLREGAFEGRRRAMELQKTNEQKLWPLMWSKMSAASQSKVREEPEFEAACLRLDSIRLWDFIRRSHLTHIYGEDDSMLVVNIHDQTLRYNSLRQGEREYISEFKTRFDNQVKANQGVGVPDVPEPIRAIDFLSKLDPKRYTGMLTQMRNNACQNLAGAYPTTLAGAFRVASTWTREGSSFHLGQEQHSAFLADGAFVTKARDTEKGKSPTGEKDQKKTRSSVKAFKCYHCDQVGHLKANCPIRISELALLTMKVTDEEDEGSQISDELAFITTEETILFSRHDILLDNQASVNIFSNSDLLKDIRRAENGITLNGVQADAKGVLVDMEGTFNEIGQVYYSAKATANILSFAAMVDSGAEVTYEQGNGRFTLRPAASNNIYSFCRREIPGSEGRFYVCDIRNMVSTAATSHKVMVQTVAENLVRYTKREVDSASRARGLLAKMG